LGPSCRLLFLAQSLAPPSGPFLVGGLVVGIVVGTVVGIVVGIAAAAAAAAFLTAMARHRTFLGCCRLRS